MTEIEEGGLIFSFPDHCEATKYDEWEFYRRRFQSVAGGSKAIDILCLVQDVSWLIEIKGYRWHQRTNPVDLGDEVAIKVRDTLAGLAAASANANDEAERALSKQRWRIALHLEQQSVGTTRLRPQAISITDVLKKLRPRLKAIDVEPMILSLQTPGFGVPWSSIATTLPNRV